MKIEEVRRLYDGEPFRPFIMHLADARQIAVQHREFLATAPSGRTVIVYQADDSFNIVDVALVADLEVRSNGQGEGNRGRVSNINKQSICLASPLLADRREGGSPSP